MALAGFGLDLCVSWRRARPGIAGPVAAVLAIVALTLPAASPAASLAQPVACVLTSAEGCPLEFGQSVQAVLENAGDVHTWRLSLPSRTGFRVALSDLQVDYDLRLHRPDGTRIAESLHRGTLDELVAAPTAEPGEYVAHVSSDSGQTSAEPYRLTARLAEPISPGSAERAAELARWGKGSVGRLAISPDGRWIAVASSLGVWLYDPDLSEGRLIHHPAPVRSVAFAPDGLTLASGSSDRTVRLWRVADGALLRSLEGHTVWC